MLNVTNRIARRCATRIHKKIDKTIIPAAYVEVADEDGVVTPLDKGPSVVSARGEERKQTSEEAISEMVT